MSTITAVPSQDCIWQKVPAGATSTTRYLIFFVPGNPGLIAFYRDFLQALAAQIEVEGHIVDVVGITLSGFETKEQHCPPHAVDLDGQVAFGLDRLYGHIATTATVGMSWKWRVVLVGHSMGGWIAMEMLRRSRIMPRSDVAVVSLIGLCPGIVHLAESTNAKELEWVLKIPYNVEVLSAVAKTVSRALPYSWLKSLLMQAMHYPDAAAEATCDWLRSYRGVHETLYLAREEVSRIRADTWDEDIWGQETASALPYARLHFLWAKNDAWIADVPRDALIAARGAGPDASWKAVMEIDETGITHDFGVSHYEVVAQKVASWIKTTHEDLQI